MQSFYNIPSSETLTNSRPFLLNNDLTIMSQSSGSAFPVENLQIGMPCFRTDLNSLWVLKDLTPTWILIADLSKTYASQEFMASNYLPLSGGTISGSLNITGGTVELGKTSVAEDSVLDFHSSGNVLDYDARIIASGGTTTSGQGNLNIVAKSLYFNGSQLVSKAMLGTGNGIDSDSVDGYHAGGNLEGQLLVLGTSGKVPSSNLPVATTTTLGGVKAGANVTIDENGVISVSGSMSLSSGITVTASTQGNIATGGWCGGLISTNATTTTTYWPVTVNVLTQATGVVAGTYTLQSIIQELVNRSHVHGTSSIGVYSRTQCQCNCNCSTDN